MNTPSSAGSAAWTTYVNTTGNPQGADFYADEETNAADTSVSFVTTNAGTSGQTYDDVLQASSGSITGEAPLAPSTVFTFELSTYDANTVAHNGTNVTYTLDILAEELNPDGSQSTSELKTFEDTSITNFQAGVIVSPEPTSGLLCLAGLAAWGIGRKLRLTRANAPRPTAIES
jgi:hypothetical protein